MARATARIVGVDAARAIALFGMFSVHILPVEQLDGSPTTAGLIAAGRSAALFAVLAGVGIALSTGGERGLPNGRSHLAAAAGLVVRAVLVGTIGLLLVLLESPVAVILTYYAALFLVAIPFLRLRPVALFTLAAVWCLASPVLSMLLRQNLPPGPGPQPGPDALGDPAALLGTLLFTGYYPVLQWTTYLLAGLAIGRLDLRRTRTAVALLGSGIGLAVLAAVASALLLGPAGGATALGMPEQSLNASRFGTTPTDSWWWLAVIGPHSSTAPDLAQTTGSALAVLGAALLLARWLPPVAAVLAAVGAIPLTLYTTHVIALAIHPGTPQDRGWLLVWHILAATLLGLVIRALGTRGPLEFVVSGAAGLARRAVAGPDRASADGGQPSQPGRTKPDS